MSDAVFSWLWLAVVGMAALGFVAAIGYLVWKNWIGPPDVDPERFAREHGWVYAKGLGPDWEIVGPSGRWTLAFRSDHGANPDLDAGGETVWSAPVDFPEGQAVFLTGQPPAWLRGEGVFGVLKFLARLDGGPRGRLAARSETVTLGDAAFDAEFAVAATDAGLARCCLEAESRRRLQVFLDTTERAPRVVWAPGELTLGLSREVTEQATLEAMIGLGEAMTGHPECRR